jgi:hypothetical protein
MTKKIDPANLPEFDLAEYLDSEIAISEYLNQTIADGDMAELAHALGRGCPSPRHDRSSQGLRYHTRSLVQGATPERQPAF